MPIFQVRGVRAYLVYDIQPPQTFIDDFTKRKQQFWPQIQGPVDEYIGDRLEQRIRSQRSIRRRRAAQGIQAMRGRIQAWINEEVNRGLAIIAYNERVELRDGANDSVVDRQSFEEAMSVLMQTHDNPGTKILRDRRNAARLWVDKCAADLTEAYFGGFSALMSIKR